MGRQSPARRRLAFLFSDRFRSKRAEEVEDLVALSSPLHGAPEQRPGRLLERRARASAVTSPARCPDGADLVCARGALRERFQAALGPFRAPPALQKLEREGAA